MKGESDSIRKLFAIAGEQRKEIEILNSKIDAISGGWNIIEKELRNLISTLRQLPLMESKKRKSGKS